MLTMFISGLPAVNLNSIKGNISFNNILKCRACRDSGNYYFLWTHRPLTKVQFQYLKGISVLCQMLWFCREKRNTKSLLVSWRLFCLLYYVPGKRSQKYSDQTLLLLHSNSTWSSRVRFTVENTGWQYADILHSRSKIHNVFFYKI